MTVGQMQGGIKHTIIPETVTLRGSLRTTSQPVRDQLIERLGAFTARLAGPLPDARLAGPLP
jgi:metal-dependent amidase/aminoacylase/carboxypeptidase family protein